MILDMNNEHGGSSHLAWVTRLERLKDIGQAGQAGQVGARKARSLSQYLINLEKLSSCDLRKVG